MEILAADKYAYWEGFKNVNRELGFQVISKEINQ
jgi:hypothetical protein